MHMGAEGSRHVLGSHYSHTLSGSHVWVTCPGHMSNATAGPGLDGQRHAAPQCPRQGGDRQHLHHGGMGLQGGKPFQCFGGLGGGTELDEGTEGTGIQGEELGPRLHSPVGSKVLNHLACRTLPPKVSLANKQVDFQRVFRLLCTAMIDNKESVRNVGIEALAVLNNSVGQQEFLQVCGTTSLMCESREGTYVGPQELLVICCSLSTRAPGVTGPTDCLRRGGGQS